jgi:hypothetical protein
MIETEFTNGVRLNMKMNGLYLLLGVITAIIGYHIHHSIFWAIMDCIFFPFAWAKWLLMKQVTLTIIKSAFGFFFK